MPGFALECYRCTQAGIQVTFTPEGDGRLHAKLTWGSFAEAGILSGGPANAPELLASLRERLIQSVEKKWGG